MDEGPIDVPFHGFASRAGDGRCAAAVHKGPIAWGAHDPSLASTDAASNMAMATKVNRALEHKREEGAGKRQTSRSMPERAQAGYCTLVNRSCGSACGRVCESRDVCKFAGVRVEWCGGAGQGVGSGG